MDPRITVGGAEPEPSEPRPAPRPGRPLLLVAIAGMALGVVFGVAFGSGPPDEDPSDPGGSVPGPAPVDTTGVPSTTTTSVPRAERLAVRVPGFVDTAVLVSTAMGGGAEVAVWEAVERSSVPRALPAGDMQADASGQWLMTVTEGRFSDLRALWVGDDAWMEPVATGVVRATWHERFPGRIAWVESRDPDPVLLVGEFVPGRPAVVTDVGAVDADAVPVWYGDEGVLLETPEGLLLVDDRDGAPIAGLTGSTLVGGGADGWLVRATDRGIPSVIRYEEGTAVRGTEAFRGAPPAAVMATTPALASFAPTDIGPTCLEAEFSPGGGLVAVRCPHAVDDDWTVEIWALGIVGVEGGTRVYSESSSRVSVPDWSPDGRFVLYAVPDQVRPRSTLVFVETSTWAGTAIVHPGRVTSLAVLRG